MGRTGGWSSSVPLLCTFTAVDNHDGAVCLGVCVLQESHEHSDYVYVCMRACVRAHVCTCMHVCANVRVCVCAILFDITFNSISVILCQCPLVADIVLPHLNAVSQAH